MASCVIAITGASAGIGRAGALAFACKGERVGLIARSEGSRRDCWTGSWRQGRGVASLPLSGSRRPDNLFAPTEGLHDTYGIFSDQPRRSTSRLGLLVTSRLSQAARRAS